MDVKFPPDPKVKQRKDHIQFLLDVFADQHHEGRIYDFSHQVKTHAKRCIQQLGTEVEDGYGHTLLMRSSGARRPERVKFLLDCGAQVRATDDNQRTALHHAAVPILLSETPPDTDGEECVRLLLEAGADMYFRAHGHTTPLLYALEHLRYVQSQPHDSKGLVVLIEHGALDDPAEGVGDERGYVHNFYGHTRVEALILDPEQEFPQDITDCVRRMRSQKSKDNLIDQVGSSELIRPIKKL